MVSDFDHRTALGLACANRLSRGTQREHYPHRWPGEGATSNRQQVAAALCPTGPAGPARCAAARSPATLRRSHAAAGAEAIGPTASPWLRTLEWAPAGRSPGRGLAPAGVEALESTEVSLARRRRWCISTDPEFARKAADIVGIYLHPPENAVVLAVDEKPHLQVLERAQGYLRLPNGRTLSGFSHDYKRHGTTTLFAAFNVLTGQVPVVHHRHRRRRREFLDFMNEVIGAYDPGQVIHVILDNLSTHKPKHDRWLARHHHVHFHFTPTRASWLNQVECWFSILGRQALQGASFTSAQELRQAMDRFIESDNPRAVPFEWKKEKVHSVHPKRYYADLRH